jgi:hypothetical protein
MENHINIEYKSYNIGVDVPQEIGELVSQRHSFINKFKWKWSALLTGIILLFTVVLIINSEPPHEAPYICIAIIWTFQAVRLLLRKTHIGIVGKDGIAVYKGLRLRKKVSLTKMYLFKNVNGLVLSRIRKSVNGIYSGTAFRFKLLGDKNATVYFRKGVYYNREEKDMDKKYGWKYLFSGDVEAAWTVFLLNDLYRKINTEGKVCFTCYEKLFLLGKETRTVELGVDYIKYNGTIFRKQDIKNIYLDNGMMFIAHHNFDSKFFTVKGDRAVIPVNEMINGKAFITLVDYLLLQ